MRAYTTSLFLSLLATPAFAGGSGESTLVPHLVNLVILLVVIVIFSRKSVNDGLKNRSELLAKEISEAERLHREADTELRQYKAMIEQFKSDREAMIERFKVQGEEERTRLIEEGQREAARLREDAERSTKNELAGLQRKIEHELIEDSINKAES